MVPLETLYGHQLGVTALDCYQQERPVSVGQDRTARVWKLAQDTHMIYRGGSVSQAAETVSLVREDWFVTGHQDGALSLWNTEKKKPVASQSTAHGIMISTSTGVAPSTSNNNPYAIVSTAAVRRSDLVLSGSHDGYLRLWKVQTTREDRSVQASGEVPIHGYVNGIAVHPEAQWAILAVGNEHRLGRWNPVARAKNRVAIVKLHSSTVETGDSDNQKRRGAQERVLVDADEDT